MTGLMSQCVQMIMRVKIWRVKTLIRVGLDVAGIEYHNVMKVLPHNSKIFLRADGGALVYQRAVVISITL